MATRLTKLGVSLAMAAAAAIANADVEGATLGSTRLVFRPHAIESGDHRAPFNRCKSKQIRDTLCLHRRSSSGLEKMLLHNTFRRVGTPMHPTPLRNPG